MQRENADAKCALQTADMSSLTKQKAAASYPANGETGTQNVAVLLRRPCQDYLQPLLSSGYSASRRSIKEENSSAFNPDPDLDSRGRETACTGVTEAYEPPRLESELSHLSLQPLKKTFTPLPSVENQLPVGGKYKRIKERKEGKEGGREKGREEEEERSYKKNKTTVITGAIKAVNLRPGPC